jgi:hypothetical protein
MAVATATALGLVAAGSSLAGSSVSFANAAKQKKAQREAELEADAAMASARKSLEKNYMESLSIQKEPYELEREAMLSAGAQAVEALRESERGLGRVGAIYAQEQQGQRKTAAAMGQEMFNLDYLAKEEDSRLRDINTQLDLGEAQGAQLAAANAEERRQQQIMSGIQGIAGAANAGLDFMDLYGKSSLPKDVALNTSKLSIPGKTPLEALAAAQKQSGYKNFDTSQYRMETPGNLPGNRYSDALAAAQSQSLSGGFNSSQFRTPIPSNLPGQRPYGFLPEGFNSSQFRSKIPSNLPGQRQYNLLPEEGINSYGQQQFFNPFIY